MSIHQSHPAIISRLKKAEGHLKSVITMMDAGKPCLDLAQQLHAVEAAISKAKRELIHDHMEHCLEDGRGAETKAALQELKELAKYL